MNIYSILTIKKAFTLIEVMIVITIIAILSVWVFIPYNFYSNISRVKVSKEIITQTLNESKSSAAWVITSASADAKNQNIAIFMKKWNNFVDMVLFDYDYSWSLSIPPWDHIRIRNIDLEPNIEISKIKSIGSNIEFNGEIIFYYKAPNWELTIYSSPSQVFWTWWLEITLGYKWVTSWVLSRNILIK